MARRKHEKASLIYLRKWRDKMGYTRQWVVDELCKNNGWAPIDQASLAKWENGDTPIRLPELIALAEVYEVPVAVLLAPPPQAARIEAMRRAFVVVRRAPSEFVHSWLASAEQHIDAN